MKIKNLMLLGLILLSGCKDPRYGDLYIKDNMNLYMREDKTFYLEKDNKKYLGTYEGYLLANSGLSVPYENEYILSFENNEIYSYIKDFSFLHIIDDNYEGFFDDLELVINSIINKDNEIDTKEEFDIMYDIESFDVPKDTLVTLRIRLYSKNENECKELFNYYIDIIKESILNDDRFNKYTSTYFFKNDFSNLEPTLINNEIWVKLEKDTFIYKGVL